MRHWSNIWRLGVKELWSLARDPMMLILITVSFTLMIYTAATAVPESLHNAAIAVVDEDGSPLSARIVSAFYPPHFTRPAMVTPAQYGHRHGRRPLHLRAEHPARLPARRAGTGRPAQIQLNVDATRMSQAFTGSNYIQQIVADEINEFARRYRASAEPPVGLAVRMRFNPNLTQAWFGALMEIINNVTMLSIILTGAALIREREHGTIEHLLVMPVTPTEIMVAKVWSVDGAGRTGVGRAIVDVHRARAAASADRRVRRPVPGRRGPAPVRHHLDGHLHGHAGAQHAAIRHAAGAAAALADAVGRHHAARGMPQFVQDIMLAAPTTHFVELGQAILYRGAGIDVVWKPFLALALIGTALFMFSLARFRKTLSQMA